MDFDCDMPLRNTLHPYRRTKSRPFLVACLTGGSHLKLKSPPGPGAGVESR